MNFTDLLDEAAGKILIEHPDAKFFEAHTPIGEAMLTFEDVEALTFVFTKDDGVTVMIAWHRGTGFSPITIVPLPWLQDQIITLPIALDMGKAIECMRTAEIDAPFVWAGLRKPLYPGVTEASYIFGCPDLDAHVFVGVESHEVKIEKM